MGKRKLDTELTPLDFTEADLKRFKDFIGCLPSDLSALAALERMQETSKPDYDQATNYKNPLEVAKLLGASFGYGASHALRLKNSELQRTEALCEPIGRTLEMLEESVYFQDRMLEGRTRTIIELIFLDRLHKLQDQNANLGLRFSTKVSVLTKVTNHILGKPMIRGYTDWTLNYETFEGISRSESTLIITEAKRAGDAHTGLPQLMIYMVGIHQQRRDRINQGVFGIHADSSIFIFVFLDHEKKFYVSKPLAWLYDQSEILAYIDTILLDAIESSPHTTPTKKGNTVLNHYQRYLEQRWVFGEKAVKGKTEKGDCCRESR